MVASGTSASLSTPDGATTVTFRATDDYGDSSTVSTTITVSAPGLSTNEFTSAYNGIAAPAFLKQEINSVSIADAAAAKIRSCVKLTFNGEPQ